MSYVIRFAGQVGTAPGTTTVQLGNHLSPYQQDFIALRDTVAVPIVSAPRRIRWDLIGIVGGGSLVVALLAGAIATALEKR